MLSYAQVRDAKPHLWLTSGDEWLAVAGHAWTAANDLKDDVQVEVQSGWRGSAGQEAAHRVQDLVDRLRVASAECRAAGLVSKGMGHALQIAQDALQHAGEVARAEGLTIDDAGKVHLPDQPMFHHDPAWQSSARDARHTAEFLISSAVRGASDADDTATKLLTRYAGNVRETDWHHALDVDLGDASRAEVDMLGGMVPAGSADDVAAWWGALSDDDRHTLVLGVPGRLEGRAGIPDSVQADLRGGNSKIDRTKVAQWALDHWHDDNDDIFSDDDANCTNFASDSLEGAGVKDKVDPWWGTQGDDTWSPGNRTGWNWFDEHDYSHSASWGRAQDSYDFWTRHGHEVSMDEARPGDLIYWEQVEPGHDIKPGTVHHTAVVTSVVDGDVRYTQHSRDQQNASFDGRRPLYELTEGGKRIHIVRPDPDW
jgi:hypothetical protein